MTESQLRCYLQELHKRGLSWRVIHSNVFPSIPPGTLNDIAKGKHVPAKWREYFHINRRAPKQRDPNTLPISQRPAAILLWQLQHREEL